MLCGLLHAAQPQIVQAQCSTTYTVVELQQQQHCATLFIANLSLFTFTVYFMPSYYRVGEN
jgi:hypothetical protein